MTLIGSTWLYLDWPDSDINDDIELNDENIDG